jgi:tetratricopeptide (TPR) repeat protein
LFDAEVRLRRALHLAPNDPNISYNLAIVVGQQGHTDEALGLINNLRATYGDHPRYTLALADIYSALNDGQQARGYLKLAFEAFYSGENAPQAALVARSISNLAFAEGLEGEALCYSYEAYGLAPGALQLGYHLAVLLGLNNYREAENFATEQIAGQPAFGAAPRVHLVRALARGAMGDLSGALKSIEVAQDLISLDPELGSEVNVVWWLLKRELPESVEDAKDSKLQDMLDGIYPEVLRLREKPVYSMLKWPRVFSDMLARVGVSENYYGGR